ncbi:transposase, partial [Mycobacterium tuberculosis]|nr:transposase [Mycobacterium tuberculosis]
LIVVGDIHSNQFNSKKGKLAKSVYDAGWFEMKRQLTYKCKHAGCRFEIVNERYTTQTCSCCGDMSSRSGIGAWLRREEEDRKLAVSYPHLRAHEPVMDQVCR